MDDASGLNAPVCRVFSKLDGVPADALSGSDVLWVVTSVGSDADDEIAVGSADAPSDAELLKFIPAEDVADVCEWYAEVDVRPPVSAEVSPFDNDRDSVLLEELDIIRLLFRRVAVPASLRAKEATVDELTDLAPVVVLAEADAGSAA